MSSVLIPIFTVIWLAWLWFVSSRIDGSSISPASIFLGYWFFAAFCPLVAWMSSLLLIEHMGGYVFLAAAATLVFAAAAIFRPPLPREPITPSLHLAERSLRRLRRTYLLVTLLAFSYPIAVFWQARETLGVTSLLEMPGVVSEARYTEDWNPGFWVNGLNTFVFIAAMLSGLLAADRPRRWRDRLAVPLGLLPGFATYYLTAARTGLLFPAVFWLAAFLCGTTYLGFPGRYRFVRFFRSGLLLVALALPVVHVGYMIRTGSYGWDESVQFWEKSVSTAFGHMSVLGHWLASDAYSDLPPFELKSLAGITEKLGLASREQGLYEVSYAVGSDRSLSNIYTAFRPLIEDGRGVVGGCAILFFVTAWANFSWHRLRRGRARAFPIVFAYLVFVFWSLITSIFIYLSTILAVVLGSVVVGFILRGEPSRNTAAPGSP